MISVILPTYNRAERVRQSIESVLKQSVKDIELIVVDDGSTDNTEDIVESIVDQRINYIKLNHNKGACAARNIGIEAAKGEYIAFQDSDENWYKNKLEIELKALKEKKADVVFCKLNLSRKGYANEVIPLGYEEGFIKSYKDVFGIATQTLLGKAEIFKANRFDTHFQRFQDLEIVLRLSCLGYKIYCCDAALMDTYYETDMQTISGNPRKLLNACIMLNKKYPKLYMSYYETCRKIAHLLFEQSFRNELNKVEKKKMRKIALIICPGIKTQIKYVLAIIGIFNKVDRLFSK